MPLVRRKGCRVALGLVILGLALASPWLYQVAMAVRDAKQAGLLDDEKTDKYRFSRENNLRAIRQALVQAAESDGQFPAAETWMDSAILRLKTSDVSEDDAKNKLRIPGTGTGAFGYVYNEALANQPSDRVEKEPETILVYEQPGSGWNAHGNPKKTTGAQALGVTLAGKIVKLQR